MIKKLITSATDFLILTEIRADHRAIMNTKLKFNLQPSHFSVSQPPRGLICANRNHKKMEGRERQSVTPGHIAAAVYEISRGPWLLVEKRLWRRAGLLLLDEKRLWCEVVGEGDRL